MDSYDIAIIGAGVHGASAAFHLAGRGVNVIVLERRTVASGPTGLSSGICRAYYTNGFLAQVAAESLRMFDAFGDLTDGGDAGFRRTGCLYLHEHGDEQRVRAAAVQLARAGTKVEVLAGSELATRFPRLVLTDVALVSWEPGAGYADPAGTTTALLNKARTLGAAVWQHAQVTRIQPHASHVRLTVSDDRMIAADRVLLAAGPWTGPLLGLIGASLPLRVERHYVVTGEPAGPPVSFAFADVPAGYYFRPEGPRRFLLGPLAEEPAADPDDFDRQVSAAEQARLAQAVAARIPDLGSALVTGGWASLYDVSPDWQPIVGQVGSRVYVDCGTSGHGFKLAPAWGRHVADLVTGSSPDPGLSQFSPGRFASDQLLDAGYGTARILG